MDEHPIRGGGGGGGGGVSFGHCKPHEMSPIKKLHQYRDACRKIRMLHL